MSTDLRGPIGDPSGPTLGMVIYTQNNPLALPRFDGQLDYAA
jgi:hypothetical protein